MMAHDFILVMVDVWSVMLEAAHVQLHVPGGASHLAAFRRYSNHRIADAAMPEFSQCHGPYPYRCLAVAVIGCHAVELSGA